MGKPDQIGDERGVRPVAAPMRSLPRQFEKRLDVTRRQREIARRLHRSLQPPLRSFEPVQHPVNLDSLTSWRAPSAP